MCVYVCARVYARVYSFGHGLPLRLVTLCDGEFTVWLPTLLVGRLGHGRAKALALWSTGHPSPARQRTHLPASFP